MNMHEMIKKIKFISIVTIFIVSFLLVFTIIYMKIPLNESGKDGINEEFSIDNNSIKYDKDSGVIIIKGDNKVKLYNVDKNKVEEIPLEEYVVGVLAGEMPANFHEEALKAQAVAARTYYFSKRINPCKNAKDHGGEICNTTHCQVYMSKEDRLSKWSSSTAESNWDKIKNAVALTEGQVLTYDDELVEYPQFFSVSSGKTENAIDVFSNDVPYLKSIDSPGEEIAPKYQSNIEMKKADFIKKVNNEYSDAKLNENNINDVSVISRTDGEGAKEIKLGNRTISGVAFRKLFNLNSTDVYITVNSDIVKIDCKGYGHRVGMSQWGANVMAKNGKDYKEILKHYYTGVEISKVTFN